VSARVLSVHPTSPSTTPTDALNPAVVIAQASTENFPVASLLLPRRVRSHLLAVYGFARLVDDVGDEFEGDRLAMLDQLEADLERAFDGTPRDPLIAALKPAIAACALPIDPFRALIEANRRDQVVHRYDTFEELLGYCALSANPVGELVLRIFGALTPERLELSNKVCSALQLAEHWQDVGEDYANGRIYLPAEDLRRFGVAAAEIDARPATPALRRLIAFEVARANALLNEGAPLIRTLRGRPAFAVAAFVAGGRSAFAAIARAGYDVTGQAPRARPGIKAAALARTLLLKGPR
jgi:squalene synthase HpnC